VPGCGVYLQAGGKSRLVLDSPPRYSSSDDTIWGATAHYRPLLKAALLSSRPAYIYERLAPGNYAGAWLSHELHIPYIVEYIEPDSATPGELQKLLETGAFRQATLISVSSADMRDRLVARGAPAWKILVNPAGADDMNRVWQRAAEDERARLHSLVSDDVARVETGDPYKDQIQNQWDNNPVGSQYADSAQPRTLQWFLEVEAHRYGKYAPWMPETMEFARHAGEDVLDVGGGMGTDLAQFATHGARVTDVDLSSGHLALARQNFALRGLQGRFVHSDAETIPLEDNSFDLVYSNGVIHHTPHTERVVREMYRVLRPGGRAIVMIYAESSLAYWRNLVLWEALRADRLETGSMASVLSRTVERTDNDAQPLVKVYTRAAARDLFRDFVDVTVLQRHLEPFEVSRVLRPFIPALERLVCWNLIVKARKPLAS
jgi:ubiquinone/menaquinone biosynthesis C-methylase UbiE